MPVRLLIDLGNTRLKWTCRSDSGPIKAHAVVAQADWMAHADALLQDWRQTDPDEVVVASVLGPARTECLLQVLQDLGRPVRLASTAPQWQQLRSAYPCPEHLGVDRWLALIAVHAERPRSRQLVVSAGSALTLDLLLPGGEHRGGLIVPGLNAMRDGLLAAAPALAMHEAGSASADDLASSSADAIASGCLQAALALIERHRRPYGRGRCCRVVLAGGDAGRLEAGLSAPLDLRPHLVLEGLARWVEG